MLRSRPEGSTRRRSLAERGARLLLGLAGAALVLALVLGRSRGAWAGPGSPPPAPPARTHISGDAMDQARQHFEHGKQLHHSGHYREAAGEYLAAYKLFPSPAFLYDTGQVFRLAGDRAQALVYYRKYLEVDPGGQGADDARAFVAELEVAIAADKKAAGDARSHRAATHGKQPRKGKAGAGAGAAAARGGAGAGAASRHPAAVAGAPSPTDSHAHRPDTAPLEPTPLLDAVASYRRRRRGRTLVIAAASSAAVGVVALGLAGMFAVQAHSASSDLSGYHGAWTQKQQDRYQDGKAAEHDMALGLILGGAALSAATVMYLVGRHAESGPEPAPPVTASATLRDGGALVVVGGAF